MKSRVLPLRWLLAAAAAGSIIAAACVANAGDDAPANDDAPRAETAAQAAPPAADAAPAEPASAAPAAEPSAAAAEPSHPAPRAAAHAAHTARKDAAAGAAAGRLSESLAKAFYTFADVAALELAPNLTVAWGIGAPRGEYVIRASIWASSAEGASELSTAELRSGGALRSAQAIRAVGGATAERAWLEAFGETGAHGVTYDLLLWNGEALAAVVGHFTSAPGNVVAPGAAAQLRDLDGDGEPELVIDRTDPYLFYYTSQIWHADAAVLRRSGDQFREVTLTLPRPGVPHAAVAGARSALAFARAGWWPYALEQAEAALALAPDDPRLAWNAIVIRERGSAALREAERSAVPWLGYLLAGDWQRSVDELRTIPYRDWLDLERVLLGTPLAGLERTVAELVEQRTAAALTAADYLPIQHAAPAHLMRGLARWWLGEGTTPAAVELVEAIPGYWRETLIFDLLWWIGYRGG